MSAAEDTLRHALASLLEWAERYRGDDPSLDSEEWYIARDYARIALATESALQRTTPKCTCGAVYTTGGAHEFDCAVLRPPTPEGGAGE